MINVITADIIYILIILKLVGIDNIIITDMIHTY